MTDQLIFLGTAGGRMSVAKQLRASGGFWAVLGGTRIHVDPGPGALVHCHATGIKTIAARDHQRLDLSAAAC